MVHKGLRALVLGHLSETNNSPAEDADEPTPEYAPRLTREILLHPDGTVQWSMDRAISGGTVQSASEQNPYGYKLDLVKEQLRDQSHARAELARRVAEKRKELMAQLAAKKGDPKTFRPSAAAK